MALASVLRTASSVFSLALAVVVSPFAFAQTGSTAADGFDPNVTGTNNNGNVYAVVLQPDGKVLLAGHFDKVQPNGTTITVDAPNIVRVLPDGRKDTSFNASVNGQINAMVLQSDGKIIIGGKFTAVNGTTRNRVARLNADGTLDTNFNPNVGANDSSLQPDVMALALQSDGKLVVGGGFTVVQPNGATSTTTRNRIARFNSDGSLDDGFNPGANNMVLSLAVQTIGGQEMVLVGGGFTNLAGTAINRIARLTNSGALDTTFNPNVNNAVSAIKLMPDNTIVIGGTFTTLQPTGSADPIKDRGTRLARLNTDGTLYYSNESGSKVFFYGNIDGPVSTLAIDGAGNILAGGSFSAAGLSGAPYIVRLTPLGVRDPSFSASPNSTVYSIAVQPNGSVIIAGGFTAVRGTGASAVPRSHVARVSPNGGLDTDFRPDANGRLRSLTVQSDGKILIAGSFTSVGGVTRGGLLRLNADGSLDTSFTTQINGSVFTAVQQTDGRIVVAGSFTRVNGTARLNIARLNTDGSLDAPYDPAPNGAVYDLVLQSDGRIVAGGTFTALSPLGTTEAVSRSKLVRINTDGSLDTGFTAQTDDTIWTMLQQSDGKIILGGSFTVVLPTGGTSPATRRSIARINADGTLDNTFSPSLNGSVFALAVQPNDNKIVVGGNFAQVAGQNDTTVTARTNLARFGSDGSLDTGYDPKPAGVVNGLLAQSDGTMVVAGDFVVIAGVSRSYVARLQGSGAIYDAFNAYLDILPGNQVVSLAQSGSNILIGGAFSQIGPFPNVVRRSRVARVDGNGVADTSFNLDTAVGPSRAINALTLQYDGRVYAAGDFASYAGTGSTNLARFYPDSMPDTTFLPNINGPVYALAEAPIVGTPDTTQHTGVALIESNGRLRESFVVDSSLVISSTITSVTVLPDGKMLLTGSFGVNGTTAHLIRLNANGSVDPDFKLITAGTVNVVRVLADGKILIGGTFTNLSDTVRNNIARLNADGSLDTTFSAAADATVGAIALQPDGKIVIGGNFSAVASSGTTTYISTVGIARFSADGVVDADFKPTPNGAITQVVVQADGKIVVGGNFSSFKPNGATTEVTRSYIARLNSNGTVDDTVDLKANSGISRIVQQPDGKILVGGNFTSLGGEVRNFIARLNAADLKVDTGFNPNPNSSVIAIVLQSDGKILIGGNFTALQPGDTSYDAAKATPRNRAARLNPDGSIDSSFNPNFNGQVVAFGVLNDNAMLVTGLFTAIQPTGSLMAGGQFTSINGLAVSNVALFSGDGSVSSTFMPNPNGTVYAILQMADGRSVIGGAFTKLTNGDVTRNRIARFNTDYSLDTGFNPNADGDIYAIALQSDGKLVIAGNFNSVGGSGHAKLARLNTDGSVDNSFNPSVSGAVRVVLLQSDGKVVFTEDSGSSNSLRRVNANGSADSSFNPSSNNQVLTAALQADGRIVVGGSFTTIAGTSKEALARLNADGSIDNTVGSDFNDGAAVTALTIQRDGKILIGGTFSTVDGLPRFGLARIGTPTVTADTLQVSANRDTLTWTRTGAQPEISGVVFEATANSTNWHELGRGTRVAGTSTWQLVGLSALKAQDLYVRASAIVPGSPNSSSGVVERYGYILGDGPNATPVISSAGSVVGGISGSSFLFQIAATGAPTSYSASGLPAGLSVNTTTGAISGTPTQTGSFTVTVSATNSSGTGTATITIVISAPGSVDQSGRIANLSVLARVTSADPIIAGFVVAGSSAQNVLIRAVGPTMGTLGVADPISGPRLTVYKGTGKIHDSANWGGSDALVKEFQRLGAFALPANSADAAVILTLAPGPYTLHVDNDAGTTGSALAEIYDASPTPIPQNSPRLVNISARGVVTTSHYVVSGFVISGTTPKQVLVRALGPGLTAQDVSGALADPKLQVYRVVDAANQPKIAENDNWETPVTTDAAYPAQSGTAIANAGSATGAAALATGSKDAAVLLTLAPGVYTASAISTTSGGTGRAMVEIYEVQ